MATLLSLTTGNFTAAGTWGLCDSAAELDSEAGSTAVSTTNLDSATFTPGAITADGVAIKLSARAVSPTGTFTITLRNSTLSTDVTSVTVNISDFNSAGNGWYFFKFSSSQLLVVATAYLIRVVCSNTGSQVTLFTNGTANNWARQLRVTTTQAPAAGDKLIIAGEHTGAGTGNDFTVTMNNTATTIFGSTAFTQSISINKRGTLTYGTTASTNYYLKYAGLMKVFGGGTLNIGTTGTPMPSTSTAVLEFSVSTNVDSGLDIANGGTFVSQGNAITNTRAFLAADVSIAATSLTTDISTGWLSGDKIALASTTRTQGECESTALTANASGTTLTVTAIASAHSGTGATKGEVINLTRNVKIRGLSTSLQGYVFIANTATVDVDYTEFSFLGSNTVNKRGINFTTTTGLSSIRFSSFYDFGVTGSCACIVTGASSNNITASDNVMWNVHSQFINVDVTSNSTLTFNLNLCIKNISGQGISLADIGVTCTNNTIVGTATFGLDLSEAAFVTGTITGNTVHACGTGSRLTTILGVTTGALGTLTSWRNGSGLTFVDIKGKIKIDTATLFGNSTNIDIGSGGQNGVIELWLYAFTVDAGTTLTSAVGITMANTIFGGRVVLDSCQFGNTTTHATADINIGNSDVTIKLVLRNTHLHSATPIGSITNLKGSSYIAEEKYNQVTGNNRTRFAYANGVIGTIERDVTIFDVSPGMRMTPNHATLKFESQRFRAAVASGQSLTISAKVRESVIGDGTAYNGAKVRLMLAANPAIGITSNTLIATATAADVGAFETISGATASASEDGVMEFYVEIDGTSGWVNVDTWSVS